MKESNMKKFIIAAALIAMTATSVSAEIVCQPVYRNIWDAASNQYVTVRTPDRCFETEPGYVPQRRVYADPYAVAPDPYYNDGAEFFMGALIGGVTGYVIGNNNNNNNNNYYYKRSRDWHYNRPYKRHENREHRRHRRHQEYKNNH